MNKKILLFSLIIITLLTSCTKDKQVETEITPPKLTISDNELEKPDKATICSDLCLNKIQNLCQEEISDNKIHGNSMEDSLLNESSCQLICEAEWTEKLYDCITLADSCAQFVDRPPYCMETEGEEIDKKDTNGCENACKNYSKCAGYGDDATVEDQKYAYESCLEVCPTWSQESKKCIANTQINKVGDCATQIACMNK